jgi:chromate reductase
MHILGVSGSLRRESFNTKLLRAAAEEAPPGVELVMFEGLRAVPPYNEDDDVEPPAEPVRRLREAFAAADALLVATPEYNSSIPGQLKNAVDWLSRPFPQNAVQNLPVAVIGASTSSFGGVWSQAEMRKTLSAAGARVLESGVAVPRAQDRFDAGGRLLGDDLREQLRDVLAELARLAERHALMTT